MGNLFEEFNNTYTGQISYEDYSTDISFKTFVDDESNFNIKLENIDWTDKSNFLMETYDLGHRFFTEYSLKGISNDGQIFETNNLTLNARPNNWSDGRISLKGSLDIAKFLVTNKNPEQLLTLKIYIKGYAFNTNLEASSSLGLIKMSHLESDNTEENNKSNTKENIGINQVSACIQISSDKDEDENTWFQAAEELLRSIVKKMYLACGCQLLVPAVERISKKSIETEFYSAGKQIKPEFAIFNDSKHSGLENYFLCVVNSLTVNQVKNTRFAFEWIVASASYTEAKLISVMTVIEAILDSNLKGKNEIIDKKIFNPLKTLILDVVNEESSKWEMKDEAKASYIEEIKKKLPDLNRKTLMQKIDILTLDWNVEIKDIRDAVMKAKNARDSITHKGRQSEEEIDDHNHLINHWCVARELATRLLLNSISFEGEYWSHYPKSHKRKFPIAIACVFKK